MVEAGCWRPGRKSFAAEVGETLLEADEVGCGLRVTRGDRAAGAGVAALEIYFADAEAHYAALVFAVELVFPECGQVSVRAGRARTSDRAAGVCDFFGPGGVCRYIGGIDFERRAKALAHGIQRQPWKPVGDRLQRCGGDNRGAVGDVVVRKSFGRVAHQNLLLEIDAEPFRGVFGAAGEEKCARGNVAAIAGNRERDGTEIRRVGGANQLHCRGALGVDPAAVDGVERPRTVVFESAAGADARFRDRDGIERLDGMQANAHETRQSSFPTSWRYHP